MRRWEGVWKRHREGTEKSGVGTQDSRGTFPVRCGKDATQWRPGDHEQERRRRTKSRALSLSEQRGRLALGRIN